MNAEIETMDSEESKRLLKEKETRLTEIEDVMGSDEGLLIKHMEAELERAKEPKLEPNCCIYKVPERMRERNPMAYTPKAVSIGPLHHGNKDLMPMEELKLGYLKSYLKRSNLKLKKCIETLKEGEEYIRSCYAVTISQSSNEFIRMILIDACFIIEHFFRYIESKYPPFDDWKVSDPIISKPGRVFDMGRDLILLENQLPFGVLEILFTPTCRNGTRSSFLEVSFFYLCSLHQCYSTFDRFKTVDEFKNNEFDFNLFCENYRKGEKVVVQHLTDFLRLFFSPYQELRPKKGGESACLKYSASQLLEAGLKFKVGQNKSLIELQFEKGGVLTMPQLLVDYDADTLLRNMVAFEQCHYPWDGIMDEYVSMLDFLINECKDVDILVEKGVLVNILGESNKVVSIFNDICMGTVGGHPYYDELSKNLNDFYEKPRHKYKAIFIRDYLSTPWKIASFGAAIVLLLLTLVQTICSIISLH